MLRSAWLSSGGVNQMVPESPATETPYLGSPGSPGASPPLRLWYRRCRIKGHRIHLAGTFVIVLSIFDAQRPAGFEGESVEVDAIAVVLRRIRAARSGTSRSSAGR